MTVVDLPQAKRTGRPRKVTEEHRRRMLEALGGGSARVHAAHLVGISLTTFERECNRNVPFADAVEKAEAAAVTRNLALIQKAAVEGQWQAAAWFLERRYAELYGRRVSVNLEEKQQIATEQATRLAQAVLAAIGDLDDTTQQRVRDALLRSA